MSLLSLPTRVTRACRRESGSAFFCRRSGARYSREMTCQFALHSFRRAPLYSHRFRWISSFGADVCMRLRRERKRKRKDDDDEPIERGQDAGKSEREEAAVSANGTDLSYRLLSSDASGITFVRFAGVDDVVAHGVGVISTREGTYLPITVLLSLLPSARTYACIYSPSFFPLPRVFFSLLFIYFPRLYSRFVQAFAYPNFAQIPASRSRSPSASSLDSCLYSNLYRDMSGSTCIRN